eukprot:m.61366 g.61366  ORF g.61366 m.61366 type:complete len:762 (+) comp11385_c2_seq3:57-2342(+)
MTPHQTLHYSVCGSAWLVLAWFVLIQSISFPRDALPFVNRCNKHNQYNHPNRIFGGLSVLLADGLLIPFRPNGRQQQASEFLHKEDARTLVLINSNCKLAREMLPVVLHTWFSVFGKELVTIKFVIGDSGGMTGECEGIDTKQDLFSFMAGTAAKEGIKSGNEKETSTTKQKGQGDDDGDDDDDNGIDDNDGDHGGKDSFDNKNKKSTFIKNSDGVRKEFHHQQRIEDYFLFLPQCKDTYPPVDKVVCMWHVIRNNDTYLENFKYFVKMDTDTYLNIPNLLILLAKNSYDAPLFAGGIGTGRQDTIPRFCMGPAYVISRYTLLLLPLDFLQSAVRYANSDVTFSRNVEKFTGKICMKGVGSQFRWVFVNRYWFFSRGVFGTHRLNAQQQFFIPFTHGLHSSLLTAVSVHPFKRKKDMALFHNSLMRGRLPLFHFPNATKNTPLPDELKPVCVYNPSLQYEISGMRMYKCPPFYPAHLHKVTRAFIIYSKVRKLSQSRAGRIRGNLLGIPNLDPVLFESIQGSVLLGEMNVNKLLVKEGYTPKLSKEEIAHRETFRLLLYDILRNEDIVKEDGLVLVLDEAVELHPKFNAKVTALLRNQRCGGYLSSISGGVLLLGATIWRNGTFPKVDEYTGGWKLVDQELKRSNFTAKCFNYNSGVYGTYAFVADIRALNLMLLWLNDPTHSHQPISRVWQYLSKLGMPVLVANPFLAYPTEDGLLLQADDGSEEVDPVHMFIDDDDKRTQPKRSIDYNTRKSIHRWHFD